MTEGSARNNNEGSDLQGLWCALSLAQPTQPVQPFLQENAATRRISQSAKGSICRMTPACAALLRFPCASAILRSSWHHTPVVLARLTIRSRNRRGGRDLTTDMKASLLDHGCIASTRRISRESVDCSPGPRLIKNTRLCTRPSRARSRYVQRRVPRGPK